jgi:hypothetical protein
MRAVLAVPRPLAQPRPSHALHAHVRARRAFVRHSIAHTPRTCTRIRHNRDGVDIDYEKDAQCTKGSDGKIKCATDAELISVITQLRDALPGKMLSGESRRDGGSKMIRARCWKTQPRAAAPQRCPPCTRPPTRPHPHHPAPCAAATWSIGAYGEGKWATALPTGSATGMWLRPLEAAGSKLDMLNTMSYDASSDYNPKQAYNAYRAIYSGLITMGAHPPHHHHHTRTHARTSEQSRPAHRFARGSALRARHTPCALALTCAWPHVTIAGIEVPYEAWPSSSDPKMHAYTIAEAQDLADYVTANGGNGMMLWSLLKAPDGGYAGPQAFSQAMCKSLGLGGCDAVLVSPA